MKDNKLRFRELKIRKRDIEKSIKAIARVARFMTDKQLEPYERMAEEHARIKEELETLAKWQ